jgi:hypothetical protein
MKSLAISEKHGYAKDQYSPTSIENLALRYGIDHETNTFALRGMKYNANEIKQRGKWD